MRTVFFSMLATSLLIHAAIGCCWHHGHEAAGCNESLLTLETEAEYGHNHGDPPKGDHSRGPCHGHSHCRGACNYLPAKNTSVGKCQLHMAMEFTSGAVAAGHSQVDGFRVTAWNGELTIRPPLRLHLLNQILLI